MPDKPVRVKVIDRRGLYEKRLYKVGEKLELDSARADILERQRIVERVPDKVKAKAKKEEPAFGQK